MINLAMKLVFLLLVSSPDQERQANILINSIHEFGGKYSNCKIYVVQGDTINAPCNTLKTKKGIILIPLKQDETLPKFYPFSQKVQACVQVEQLIAKDIETMVWMDVDALVLKQPDEFELKNNKKIAIVPVNLRNNVGLLPDSSVDKYWEPIYKMTNLNVNDIPIVETYVENQKVRAYLNCAIFSIRPKLGICQEWIKIFRTLVNDHKYQKEACITANQKIFLHQSILSAIIVSKVKWDEISWFTLGNAYPLHHQQQLVLLKKMNKLNDITSLIYGRLWGTPHWMMNSIQVDEPLKSWLDKEYLQSND